MSNARTGVSGRRLLLLLLLVGFVALVTSRFTDLQDLVGTLSRGQWQWVLASLALHIIYFGFYALLYQVGFEAVEVESQARKLLPVFFASLSPGISNERLIALQARIQELQQQVLEIKLSCREIIMTTFTDAQWENFAFVVSDNPKLAGLISQANSKNVKAKN